MNVRDLNPNDIVKLVKQLDDYFTQIKSKQYIGGDGVKTFRPHTDYVTIDAQDANFMKPVRVIFTPSDSSLKSGLVFKMVAVNKQTIGGTPKNVDITDSFRRKIVGSGNVQVWEQPTAQFYSDDERDCKFYFFATSDGTIDIEYM